MSDIVDSWNRNQELVLMLLDAVPDEGFGARYSPRTRSVASQFAHLHNVRVSQMEARFRRGVGDLEGFPRGAEPSRAEVRKALVASAIGVATMLAAFEEKGKVPSWKGSPTSFLSYFVAHEAHHRGLVMVTLRMAGVKAPKELMYGLWSEWEKAPR